MGRTFKDQSKHDYESSRGRLGKKNKHKNNKNWHNQYDEEDFEEEMPILEMTQVRAEEDQTTEYLEEYFSAAE